MSLKEIAKSFLQLAGTGRVDDAFSQFISPSFIHHNQYFEGSRTSLADAMTQAHAENPNKSIEVKKSYMDKDTVITHSLVRKVDMDIVVVHLFRFEGTKIVELWDVGQIALKESPNSNGHF